MTESYENRVFIEWVWHFNYLYSPQTYGMRTTRMKRNIAHCGSFNHKISEVRCSSYARFCIWWTVSFRVLLEKLIVALLVKIFSVFMEPEGSLPCSQDPTLVLTWGHISVLQLSSLRSILMYSFDSNLGLLSGLITSCLPIKILYAFCSVSMCATCLIHPHVTFGNVC
jgi:hypothetical protein